MKEIFSSSAKELPILCHRCGERCGTHYIADGIDYKNGEGEAFADANGAWHCCQGCLDVCGKESYGTLPPISTGVLLLILGIGLILLATLAVHHYH